MNTEKQIAEKIAALFNKKLFSSIELVAFIAIFIQLLAGNYLNAFFCFIAAWAFALAVEMLRAYVAGELKK